MRAPNKISLVGENEDGQEGRLWRQPQFQVFHLKLALAKVRISSGDIFDPKKLALLIKN